MNPNNPGTHHLYRADVSTVNTDECNKQYDQPVRDQNQICALGSDDADACDGDSGGPLVKADDETQIGLVSFGSDCDDPSGQPGVYTRVSDNLDWIKSITGVETQDSSSSSNNNNNYNPSNGGYDYSTTTDSYGGAGGGGSATRPDQRPTVASATTTKPQGFTWPIIGG